MAITVVGSVAFDSIETPAGRMERCLGGAAAKYAVLTKPEAIPAATKERLKLRFGKYLG